MRRLLFAATMLVAPFALQPAHATLLWISDADDNIGEVDTTAHDVVAGTVHDTGQSLTDIAFSSSGQMYGTTFTNLLTINRTTGASASVGSYAGESGMNALLGTSSSLLGASFQNTNLYAINPGNAALAVLEHAPNTSSGDLAIHAGVLYGLGNSGGDNTLETLSGSGNGHAVTLHVGSALGPTLSDVFGLADDGTTLWAVAGTEVYSVDPATGIMTPIFNYALAENGQDLTTVTGAAFIAEGAVVNPLASSVPEPASLWPFLVGLVGLGAWRLLPSSNAT